jgi:tetratricopeptide (TPR) repeat protein
MKKLFFFDYAIIGIIAVVIFAVLINLLITRKNKISEKSTARTHAWDHLKQGNEKLGMKNYKEALIDIEMSINLDPNHRDSYILRAIAKNNLADTLGALNDYSKAIELSPISSSAPYYDRGILKYYLKDFRGAIVDFSKNIEVNPEFNWAYLFRGLAKIKIGLKDSGCLDLSKAGELGKLEAYDSIRKYCN